MIVRGAAEIHGDRRLPGEVGIWVFIFGDLMMFSLFFATFLYYRAFDAELFRSSQEQLNQSLGVVNTILMLSSSWLVATAVQSARRGVHGVAQSLFALAFLCGIGFILVKVFEYGEKFEAGITLSSNDFFMYYFTFTGIHALHVIVGMGILLYLTYATRSAASAAASVRTHTLESGGVFWHLVDLLWIVLFALLYMVN